MEGDTGYALQKLELAVIDLATGGGDVRSRLEFVHREHLHILRERDFPIAFRSDWARIDSALKAKGPKTDSDGSVYVGALRHTLSRIRNKTGSRIASDIVVLAEKLRYYLENPTNES